MNVVEYSEVEVTKEAREFVNRLRCSVDDLIDEYKELINDNSPDWRNFAHNGILRALESLEKILSLVGDNLRNARVLDLGCGTYDDKGGDNLGNQMYVPWLPRIIHSLGGNVIGADIGDLSREIFPRRQLNLVNTLLDLEYESINLVHMKSLLNSTKLQMLITGKEDYSVYARQHSGQVLLDILKPQLKRIVKREGYFLNYSGGIEYDFSGL